MKYFFLSQGWQIRRVWSTSGLWNEVVWRRKPEITRMGLYLVDGSEEMFLYKVEDVVQMVEVIPDHILQSNTDPPISHVRINRLVSADQALERITPLNQPTD